MVGRAMLTCDIDERWNGPPPRCESMRTLRVHSEPGFTNCFFILVTECDALPELFENGKLYAPNGTFYGSKVEFVCNQGHKLDGPKSITCLGNGQWTDQLPVCVKSKFVFEFKSEM